MNRFLEKVAGNIEEELRGQKPRLFEERAQELREDELPSVAGSALGGATLGGLMGFNTSTLLKEPNFYDELEHVNHRRGDGIVGSAQDAEKGVEYLKGQRAKKTKGLIGAGAAVGGGTFGYLAHRLNSEYDRQHAEAGVAKSAFVALRENMEKIASHFE